MQGYTVHVSEVAVCPTIAGRTKPNHSDNLHTLCICSKHILLVIKSFEIRFNFVFFSSMIIVVNLVLIDVIIILVLLFIVLVSAHI